MNKNYIFMRETIRRLSISRGTESQKKFSPSDAMRIASYSYVHNVYVCVCVRIMRRGVQLRVVRWAKVAVGGKCTKEGGMRAEVGTNAESFNEFE